MNLLLLGPGELAAPDLARIGVDRYPPRPGLWPPLPGRLMRVGLRDGAIHRATVTRVEAKVVDLQLHAPGQPPPPPLALTLLLALPRPKMLRRVLRSATELGIKRIVLMNAGRVDKSYWQSPMLEPQAIDACLREGLEQCVDTVVPQLLLRPRFRPFVEDELPALAHRATGLVAHPSANAPPPPPAAGPVVLAVGPEGGFSDFELDLLKRTGLAGFSLGPRVLRVETAVPVLAATLLPPRGP